MALKMTKERGKILKDIQTHLECNKGRKYLLIVDTENKLESYLRFPDFWDKNINVIMLDDFYNMKVKECWGYTRITYDVRNPLELLESLYTILSEFPERIFNPQI